MGTRSDCARCRRRFCATHPRYRPYSRYCAACRALLGERYEWCDKCRRAVPASDYMPRRAACRACNIAIMRRDYQRHADIRRVARQRYYAAVVQPAKPWRDPVQRARHAEHSRAYRLREKLKAWEEQRMVYYSVSAEALDATLDVVTSEYQSTAAIEAHVAYSYHHTRRALNALRRRGVVESRRGPRNTLEWRRV